MRKTLLLVTLLAATAFAAGITLDPLTRFEFTDCASGGSANQTLTENQYLLRITDADVWVCWAATCASGGERFPVGFAAVLTIPRGGSQLSCRSTASNGDAIFTRVQ